MPNKNENREKDFIKEASKSYRKAAKEGIEIIHPEMKPGALFSFSMRGDRWLQQESRKELLEAGNRQFLMLLDNVRLLHRQNHLFDVHLAVLAGEKILFPIITAGIQDETHRDPQFNYGNTSKPNEVNVWNLFEKLFIIQCHSSEKDV